MWEVMYMWEGMIGCVRECDRRCERVHQRLHEKMSVMV